jgi:hypothetical protein
MPEENHMTDDERKAAAAQAAGLYAQLNNVEIFRTGTWNGDKYTETDLDDIVSAFDKAGFKPPVKLGHAEKSGDPAFGFVDSVKRTGDRLVASLIDLPDTLAAAIKDRRFDSVSSEIFFNLKRDGQKFRRALKAVALLGAEIPAVAGLKPLRESELFSDGAGEFYTYSLTKGDFEMANEDTKATEDKAVSELEQRVAELTAELETAKAAKSDDSDAVLQVKALTERVEELTKVAENAEASRRKDRIDARVKEVPFPALKAHFGALYDLASRDGSRTAMFKLDEEAEAEISGEKVIDDLVRRLTKIAEQNFTAELSHGDDLSRANSPSVKNPGAELDRLAAEYSEKNDVEYDAAFDAICKDPDNKELVRAYTMV